MKLEIRTQAQFEEVLTNGDFSKVKFVRLWNLTNVTEIPAIPNAMDFWLNGKRIK